MLVYIRQSRYMPAFGIYNYPKVYSTMKIRVMSYPIDLTVETPVCINETLRHASATQQTLPDSCQPHQSSSFPCYNQAATPVHVYHLALLTSYFAGTTVFPSRDNVHDVYLTYPQPVLNTEEQQDHVKDKQNSPTHARRS